MVFGLFEKSHDLTQQQASDSLVVTSVTKRPRAIVVIFGHLGANVDQISKYAQLYHDYKCSTICATAPILSLASNDTTMLGEVAITACRETARLIRMAEMSEMGFGRVPVVVHVLGNGGALVLEELEHRLLEVVSKGQLEEMMKAPNSRPSTPRRRMGKSSSTRALMVQSGSSRNLMKPPLVKSTSAPAVKSKGSTRSLLTATSLSEDEEDPARSPRRPNDRSLVVTTLDSNETGESLELELCAKHPIMDIPCGCSPVRLEYAPNVLRTPVPRQLSQRSLSRQQLLSSPIHISALPQFPLVSSNPLHRRLQRRRRRKLTSPNVKRIDMERSGLVFSTTPRYNPEARAYHRDMELFASRLVLGCLVFDSAPYFPSIDNELAALETLLDGQNPAMKFVAQSAIIGSRGLYGLTQFNYFKGLHPSQEPDLDREGQFWQTMKNIRLSRRHAFIFSKADRICDRNQIKSLIKEHQNNGINTIEVELLTSLHLQHRKRRCDKYSEFVERVLNSLDGRMSVAQESLSECFDSDEDGTESGHEILEQPKATATRKYNIVETGCDDKG
jgi:Eukaryotic protein of unknown function (DUF829)